MRLAITLLWALALATACGTDDASFASRDGAAGDPCERDEQCVGVCVLGVAGYPKCTNLCSGPLCVPAAGNPRGNCPEADQTCLVDQKDGVAFCWSNAQAHRSNPECPAFDAGVD
ncbi:MAG: hypothetical protein KC503_38070 [Myxococcales bacterium]|nr:hypothetical protein [Myxococcales bacterium]